MKWTFEVTFSCMHRDMLCNLCVAIAWQHVKVKVNVFQMMLEEHNYMKKRVMRAPIEGLDMEGSCIIDKICGSHHNCKGKGWYTHQLSTTQGLGYGFVII